MKSGAYYAEKYKKMYMEMAVAVSCISKCKRRQVGCVIVLDDGMVAHGVNGMPSGSDCETCEDESGATKPSVRHAEVAAMDKVFESKECANTDNSVAFVTCMPCENCAALMASFGVIKVFYLDDYHCEDGLRELDKHSVEYEKLEL